MRISVVVPTLRREADLRRCLAALAAQTRPAEPIVWGRLGPTVRGRRAGVRSYLESRRGRPPRP